MRKQGKKIKHPIATKPFGIKDPIVELNARAALVAMENNCVTEDHLVSLYTLAQMCMILNAEDELHIHRHTHSIKRLIEVIHEHEGYCDGLAASSMIASANVLLEWFAKQNNLKIAQVAHREINKLMEEEHAA